VTDLRRGFPDLNIMIEKVIAEGDFVSIRSRVTGTHLGTYRGIPPTGRTIAQSQLHMFHVVDGQIHETWQEIDGLGIMQQLGIFPRGNPPTLLLRLVIGAQKMARRR
jgi:predicted ester cyclase